MKGFAPEKKAFLEFAGNFGGRAEVQRRSWKRGEGAFDRETFVGTGVWPAVMSGKGIVPVSDGAAFSDRSEAVILLPEEADVAAGDRILYSAGEKTERFFIAGAPVRYPTHLEVRVRKEEWV